MESPSTGRRKLTIDVLLPHNGLGSLPWRDGARLYYIPVVLMRKTPATSNIDLTDEDGRTLPILNRVENARITWHAIDAVTQRLLKLNGRPRQLMRAYLRGAVFDGRPEYQAAYVAAALGVVQQTRPELIEGTKRAPGPAPEFLQLRQIWKDVAANSILWLGLVGVPAERRVLHFTHHVLITRTPIWPTRSRWTRRVLSIDGDQRQVRLFDIGDGNTRGLLQRLWNRFATAIGWAGYDITVDSRAVRRAESYHLQFTAPEGVEVRGIGLRAQLVNSVGRPRPPEIANNRETASLYFFGLRAKREGPADINVRIGRRGFLTYATQAWRWRRCLWVFEHFSPTLAPKEVVVVPILLVVPALLALFILRPGEHALASHMLAGARTVSSLLMVEFDFDLTSWGEARDFLRYVALGSALASLLVEPARRVGVPRPLQEEPELLIADIPETWGDTDGQPVPAEHNRAG